MIPSLLSPLSSFRSSTTILRPIATNYSSLITRSSFSSSAQIDEKQKALKKTLDLDKERKDRSFDEMAREADEYIKLFSWF